MFNKDLFHYAERRFLENSSLWEILPSDKDSHTQKAQKNIFDMVDEFLNKCDFLCFKIQGHSHYFLEEIRLNNFFSTQKEALSLREYNHFENFGVHRKKSLKYGTSFIKIFRSTWPWNWTKRVYGLFHNRIWFPGYIKRQLLPFLMFLYDLFSLKNLKNQ